MILKLSKVKIISSVLLLFLIGISLYLFIFKPPTMPKDVDWIGSRNDEFYTVRKGNKLGLLSLEGELVTPCEYDKIEDFSNGMAAVKKGDDWGFVDHTGKLVTGCRFDEVKDFSEGLAAVKRWKYWSYIDKTGKLAIEWDFGMAYSFKNGKANAIIHKVFVSIDKTGKKIGPSTFPKAVPDTSIREYYDTERYLWGYKKNNKIVIGADYLEALPFKDGMAWVNLNDLWGAIDTKGNTVIPFQYAYMPNFREGLASTAVEEENDEITTLSPPKGFINNKGERIIPFKFFDAGHFSEGLAWVESYNCDYGYIDKTGKLVIPYRFNIARHFSEGLAAVHNGDKWGFIDKTGKLVIPYQFWHADRFEDEVAIVYQIKDHPGIINKDGEWIVRPSIPFITRLKLLWKSLW